MISMVTFRLYFKGLFCKSKLHLGSLIRVAKGFEISIGKGTVFIGNRFSTRKDVSIIVDGDGVLKVGANVFMNRNCSIAVLHRVSIGDSCLFGENVKIYDHNHIYGMGNLLDSDFIKKEIKIGNNVWVCSNVVICAGVSIGDNSVIGANSVVYKDIPNDSIYLCNGEIRENDKKMV